MALSNLEFYISLKLIFIFVYSKIDDIYLKMLVLAMQFSRGVNDEYPTTGLLDHVRGRASTKKWSIDHAFKAEETNTGHCAPTRCSSEELRLSRGQWTNNECLTGNLLE